MIIILANIYTSKYGFINKKYIKIVCQIFEIKL